MIIYSKKIILFRDELKYAVKSILTSEIGLKVIGDRFYDHRQRISYCIKVVIYNNKSMLGYFDSNFYELGFHECLMHVNREQLHNIIRHELAHYLTFITLGTAIQPHGPEFRAFCQRLGWGEEVYNATVALEDGQMSPGCEESAVFRKIQKLLALATSSNKNEAEQAMIKSQQLLLKHNVEAKYLGADNDEKVFLKRILKQKRENAKMRAIARILETFFVTTVFNRTGDFTYLEILGNEVNIKIAEYVAQVLENELDKLWEQARKQANLKGTIAKNSFYLGLAKGYCNKIQAFKSAYTSDVTNALMVIEKQLSDARAMAYQRLTTSTTSRSHCSASSAVGEQMGKQLNINPALNRQAHKSEALIGYSG